MKKIIYNILLGVVLMVAATSCDVINEDDRLIGPIDTDSFEFTQKVVLLEEFTGHLCINCPTGAEIVTGIEEWAQGHIIPVSIHCGPYAATSKSYPEDFTTEAGDAYYEEFNPDAFPSCMMDRQMDDGVVSINSNYDTWQTDFIYCAAQTASVDIELEVTRNERELSIDVTVEAIYDVDDDVSLQLWLIEDGIIAAQLTPSGINTEYVHNHVLRDAINGTWGDPIGSISAGSAVDCSYSYTIAEDYEPENCKVVAFVFETESRGNVLQAAEWSLQQ